MQEEMNAEWNRLVLGIEFGNSAVSVTLAHAVHLYGEHQFSQFVAYVIRKLNRRAMTMWPVHLLLSDGRYPVLVIFMFHSSNWPIEAQTHIRSAFNVPSPAAHLGAAPLPKRVRAIPKQRKPAA